MSYQANDLFDLLPMDDNASENGSKPSSNNVDPQEESQTLQQVAEDHDAKKSKVKSEIEDIFDGLYWASLSLEQVNNETQNFSRSRLRCNRYPFNNNNISSRVIIKMA